MKLNFLLFVFVFLASYNVKVYGSQSIFAGPQITSTSYSNSVGSSNRDSQTSYGAQGFLVLDRFAGGLEYNYFAPNQTGNQSINVRQDDQWLEAEGKYRIWNENFSPYVSLGFGTVFESVSTQVLGASDKGSSVYFVRDLGLGLLGRITSNIGVTISAKYYQYSNINGFVYGLSFGYFSNPEL